MKRPKAPEKTAEQVAVERRQTILLDKEIEEEEDRFRMLARGKYGKSSLLAGVPGASGMGGGGGPRGGAGGSPRASAEAARRQAAATASQSTVGGTSGGTAGGGGGRPRGAANIQTR